MKTFRCDLVEFPAVNTPNKCVGVRRARVLLKEDHPSACSSKGDVVVTSQVKMIDYERGILVTRNSVYLFEGENE